MSEFKRCINVFTQSPFQVRLMLLNMICDWVAGKPQQEEDKQQYSQAQPPGHIV